MTTDLQALLDHVRKEAVTAAETEAALVRAQSQKQADETLRSAERRAAQIVADAEREAKALVERGERTLQLAARDLILSIGQAVESLFAGLVRAEVRDTLNTQLVEQMLIKIVGAFALDAGGAPLDVLLSPHDRDALVELFKTRFRDQLAHGLELRADPLLAKGFKVALQGGRVLHDFSAEAIAEAIGQLVRPRLAAISAAAARELAAISAAAARELAARPSTPPK